MINSTKSHVTKIVVKVPSASQKEKSVSPSKQVSFSRWITTVKKVTIKNSSADPTLDSSPLKILESQKENSNSSSKSAPSGREEPLTSEESFTSLESLLARKKKSPKMKSPKTKSPKNKSPKNK